MIAQIGAGKTATGVDTQSPVMIFIIDHGNGVASRDGDVDRWWWFLF